jgi:ethanolamine utilization microcompartment shell protein EutL
VRHQKLPAAFSGPARVFGGERLSAKLIGGTAGKTRWTSASNLSWGDVLALAGEEPDAIREGVRVALAKCERGDLPAAGAGRRDCPSIRLRRGSYYLSNLSVA